jgi:hypothetical protein
LLGGCSLLRRRDDLAPCCCRCCRCCCCCRCRCCFCRCAPGCAEGRRKRDAAGL